MPITSGAGNPVWTWDETILALNLLYRHSNALDRSHSEVIDLSNLLQTDLFYPRDGRRPSFRNPDGVALKLQNLLSAIDPARGLSSSKTDRRITREFPASRALEVTQLANSIENAIIKGEQIDQIPGDEMFIEGQISTSRHRRRDYNLRKKLLAQRSDEELGCAICDFSPPPLPRKLRESFLEAHHILPLATIADITLTRVSDMALLCAGCHRYLHKLIAIEKRWISIDEARTQLLSAK